MIARGAAVNAPDVGAPVSGEGCKQPPPQGPEHPHHPPRLAAVR